MLSLSGKNILFISPKVFGYENEILNTMQKMGANVTYFEERPDSDFFTKFFIRINNRLVKRRIDSYYERILAKIEGHAIDYVFIVKAESLTENNFRKVKSKYPDAIYILYLWDSIKNNKNALNIYTHFDRVGTFDKNDSNNLNNVFFRPLFFSSNLIKAPKYSCDKNYDYCFIGTIHSDRYRILKKLKKQGFLSDKNSYIFLYIPNIFLFWIRKIFFSQFWFSNYKEFNFISLSAKESIKKMKESNIIIDIHHPKQKGLTLRTFESIGLQKKLVTTNNEVVNYDFYNKSNVELIDRKHPVIHDEFINSDFVKLKKDVYEYYTVEFWIRDIFGING